MSKLSNETMYGESSEKRSNTFLGVVGAVIGALLGAAIWVGVYQLGYIAAIAGIAIIYLSCKGYALLSGSDEMKGVIISIVMSLLALSAAHFLCWGLEIFHAFSAEYEITLWNSILAVPSIAFSEEYVVDFVKEGAMGLVLICVGVVPFIRKARHNGEVNENMNADVNAE